QPSQDLIPGTSIIASHIETLLPPKITDRRLPPKITDRRSPRSGHMEMSGWSADKDAKRMPRRIGIDPQRLLRVIRAVLEQPGAERQRPLVLDVQVSRSGHRGIQVQLLRDRAVRPHGL